MSSDYGNLNKSSAQTSPIFNSPVQGRALPLQNSGKLERENLLSTLFSQRTAHGDSSPAPLTVRRIVQEDSWKQDPKKLKEIILKSCNIDLSSGVSSPLSEKIQNTLTQISSRLETTGKLKEGLEIISSDIKRQLGPNQPNYIQRLLAGLSPSSSFVIQLPAEKKSESKNVVQDKVEDQKAPFSKVTDAPKNSENTAERDENKQDKEDVTRESKLSPVLTESEDETPVDSFKNRNEEHNVSMLDTSVDLDRLEENIESKIQKRNESSKLPILLSLSNILDTLGFEDTVKLAISGDIPIISEDGKIYMNEEQAEDQELQKFIETENLTPIVITPEDHAQILEAFESIILPLFVDSLNRYMATHAKNEQPQKQDVEVGGDVEVVEGMSNAMKTRSRNKDKDADKKAKTERGTVGVNDPTSQIESKKAQKERVLKLKKEKFEKSMEKIHYYNTNDRLRNAAETKTIANGNLNAQRLNRELKNRIK